MSAQGRNESIKTVECWEKQVFCNRCVFGFYGLDFVGMGIQFDPADGIHTKFQLKIGTDSLCSFYNIQALAILSGKASCC